MLSQHCPRLKKSWNLYYFSFFLKSPQTHLLPLSSCEMGKHRTHFSGLCKDKLCSVWETRCSQGKNWRWKKKSKSISETRTRGCWTSSRRLLFARYLGPSRWCKGSLSHCHIICSLYSTISLNHISTPNISWTATELHTFLCKDSLKSYSSQSSFYLSSFEESSRGIVVSHNAGTQLVHHPSGFNQALQKGNTE